MLRRLFGGGKRATTFPPAPTLPPAPALPGAPTSAPEPSDDPAEAIAAALDRLDVGPDIFAVFTSDASANRYVQVVTGDQGRLRGEAVSNAYLAPEAQLDDARVQRLRQLGWTVDGDPVDNYWREWPDWRADRRRIRDDLLATLEQVYEMPPTGPLAVETDH